MNARLTFSRAFHVQGQVLIESEMMGSDVNPANLSHACLKFARATDEHGAMLHSAFGGSMRFEESKTESYQALGTPSPIPFGFV